MTKHHEFDKAAAVKKLYAKPRNSKDIEQEYANTASTLGDTYFALELKRAQLQSLTLRLSELKDEHEAAKVFEAEQATLTPAIPATETPAEVVVAQ